MDIYSIEKPFGLLDDETKAALRAHKAAGGKAEWFSGTWGEVDTQREWFDGSTYRAVRKPEPLVIWVNEYPNGLAFNIYDTEAAAIERRTGNCIRTVKFVEVL
jgi:hypothetical protein